MRLVAAVLVAFAMVLAGCLSGDPPSDSKTTTTTGSSNSEPTATSGPGGNETGMEPEAPSNQLLLTNCLAAKAFINYPSAIAPGERPDGWGPDAPNNIAAVSILTFKCDRIAIAGFERGPVNLLMDLHGNAEVPPDCAADAVGLTQFRILRHLVLDDPEIGTYLQSRFGVPILLATFTQTNRDVGAGAFHDLSWSIEGDTPSVVTVFDAKLNGPYPTMRERLFWQAGDGVGALALEVDGNGPNNEPPANGTIQPPMLLASDTEGHFVGNGAWFDSMNGPGIFTRYADLECKEPMP